MARLLRRDRVSVTLSPAMRLALEHLAARHGTPFAQEATIMLRQALARTIETPDVQRKVREHKAARTAAEWRDEEQVDHAIETARTAREWDEAPAD